MGRGDALDSRLVRTPAGDAWRELRQRLFRQWGGRPACFACGHPVDGPDAGEIEHRISWRQRPDLAWVPFWRGERFLVPVHGSDYSRSGGPNKRCATCGLACNLVIGSNAARRDHLGRSLPLTPAEITAAQQRSKARNPGRKPPVSRPKPGEVPRIDPVAGRPW